MGGGVAHFGIKMLLVSVPKAGQNVNRSLNTFLYQRQLGGDLQHAQAWYPVDEADARAYVIQAPPSARLGLGQHDRLAQIDVGADGIQHTFIIVRPSYPQQFRNCVFTNIVTTSILNGGE